MIFTGILRCPSREHFGPYVVLTIFINDYLLNSATIVCSVLCRRQKLFRVICSSMDSAILQSDIALLEDWSTSNNGLLLKHLQDLTWDNHLDYIVSKS